MLGDKGILRGKTFSKLRISRAKILKKSKQSSVLINKSLIIYQDVL